MEGEARAEVSIFPDTPKTLVRKAKELAGGNDEFVWKELVESYAPVLKTFVKLRDPKLSDADVEDVVQEVFAKLVGALRRGAYGNARGRFRSFLSVIVRNVLVDRYRRQLTRPETESCAALDALETESLSPDAGTILDVKWRLACRQAAVTRVLTESALSDQSRKALKLSEEGLSNAEIAEELGLAANAVRRILSRAHALVARVEKTLV